MTPLEVTQLAAAGQGSAFALASMLDWLPIAVAAMDSQHTIVSMNEASAEVAGMRPEQAAGKKLREALYDSPGCRANTCAAGEALRVSEIRTGEVIGQVRVRSWPVRVICGSLQGSRRITQNIHGVAGAAEEPTRGANNTKSSSGQLSEMADSLRRVLTRFRF